MTAMKVPLSHFPVMGSMATCVPVPDWTKVDDSCLTAKDVFVEESHTTWPGFAPESSAFLRS